MAVFEVLAASEDYDEFMEEQTARRERGESEEPEGAPLEVVRRAIRKLHESLGHPQKSDLLRVLVHGGASPLALREARLFVCPACDEQKVPQPARLVSLPRDYSPLSEVALDVKWLPGLRGKPRRKVLSILDMASKFHVAAPFGENEAETHRTEKNVSYALFKQ